VVEGYMNPKTITFQSGRNDGITSLEVADAAHVKADRSYEQPQVRRLLLQP
jgi:hypothetical protein